MIGAQEEARKARPISRDTSPKSGKKEGSQNGQDPMRGRVASDEEVMAHAEKSFKRNYRLGQLLAR